MGRQDGKQWSGKWQSNASAMRSWDYWHGAWSAWDRKKGNVKQQDQSDAGKPFPKYSEMEVSTEDAAKVGEALMDDTATPGSAPDGKQQFLKSMQKAINLNRKLEAKFRKLSEDKARKTKMWQDFQCKLKENFFSQLPEYQQDMQKIDQELKQQKEEALQNVS